MALSIYIWLASHNDDNQNMNQDQNRNKEKNENRLQRLVAVTVVRENDANKQNRQ